MALTTSQEVLIHVAKALAPVTEYAQHLGIDAHWAYIPAYTICFIQLFSVFMLWIRYINFGGKKTPFLGSCAMSVFHALICIFAGYAELSKWDQPEFPLDTANTPIQSLQLQFSLSYLVADTLYFLLFDPDWFMMAHHALAGLYIAACLHLGVGGISSIFVFFMGEITTPLYNVFSIAKELKREYAVASKILNLVSPLFTFSFVLVRSIISPVLIGFFLKKLLFESPAIPQAYRVFLASLVGLGMIGSQLWAYKLVKGYKKAKADARRSRGGARRKIN